MKNTVSRLWIIPIITIFIYSATVLFNIGYVSYFGITSTVVNASFTDNIVFSYIWVKGLFIVSLSQSIFFWIVIGIILGFLGFFWYKVKTWILVTLIVFMGFFTYQSVLVGETFAKNTDWFYSPTEGCLVTATGTRFIIPYIVDKEAILVPIDNNNKLTGGFTIKPISDIPCVITLSYVGKIEKK